MSNNDYNQSDSFYSRETRIPHNVLITSEHGGNLLPPGYSWGKDINRDLPKQHWAYDPGAKELAIELASVLECPIISGNYTRLLVDLNRAVTSKTLCRSDCDNIPVELNNNISSSEILKRISKYYLPYHFEMERLANMHNTQTIVSIHSFTKNYEGSIRDFEIGVLYTITDSKLAETINNELLSAGFSSRLNEPWSGFQGCTYAIECCKLNNAHNKCRNAILLEVRNDLCQNTNFRSKLIEVLLPILIKNC